MKELVSNSMSRLFASTAAQPKNATIGARRSSRSLMGVMCIMAAMLLAFIATPNVYAAIGVKFLSSQQVIPLSGTNTPVPTGVVVDSSGNIYYADDANSSIVEISTTNVVSTLTIPGYTPSGDIGTLAIDASNNLWIADHGAGVIIRWHIWRSLVSQLC